MPMQQPAPDIRALRDEVDSMLDVLMGRVDAPIQTGIASLMEVASSFYQRALEINMMLHRLEADGITQKASKLYKFRTGELRDFTDLAKAAAELGSRRITAVQTEEDVMSKASKK